MLPPLDAPLGLCGGFGWKKKTRKRNGERHFWISQTSTINLAAICTQADYNMRPLDTIYRNFMDALPVVKYCSENNKRLIHLSTCEVYGKTIGSFLPTDHRVRQDPAYFILKEDASPCIFGPIEKQWWSYACAKQLIERLVYG
ncbi:hypothetical protein RHMOL_Rhmol01G0099500 [Rhododendron molle]|uniref:Uncharacterized protein n=1 Tax=Rhododendron molle TaxID=49168 RepID=A0ACC0PZJ2_RHOML|nr:hypothetical protein RHMOL_Rhmol01G0099500 [Rhododendron molle]